MASVTMTIQDSAPDVAPCDQGPFSIPQVSDTRVFTSTVYLIQFISDHMHHGIEYSCHGPSYILIHQCTLSRQKVVALKQHA